MRHVLLLAGLLGVATAGATAAEPGGYRIDGFRSARWGMSLPDVRAAAALDLGVMPEAIEAGPNPVDGTMVLIAGVPRIDPGPVPPAISYVFGARSGTLIQITIIWSIPDATDAQRQSLAAAGQRLVRYFKTQPVQPPVANDGGVAGPGRVILYRAEDSRGASIQVSLNGVAFDVIAEGKRMPAAAPTGTAVLRLAYISNTKAPDIEPQRPSSE